jgi:hypothetical protein
MVIYVGQSTHHVDHLDILWFYLMHQLDGHTFVYCPLATKRLRDQLIRIRAHFPDYPVKKIPFDNTSEFSSQVFNEYCMYIGIDIEHPVAHVHTQNGLA